LPKELTLRRAELAVAALLVLASGACVALVLARQLHSHTTHYRFLIWNLALAWIPLALAAMAHTFAASRRRVAYVLLVPTAVAWLLFFPNAPYLLTDFLHITESYDNVPAWYDVMMITWFAWVGLLLGIASLLLMQEIAVRAWGRAWSWVAVVAATVLGSVGIYLGRFLQWNSWDVFHSPLAMARRVWQNVTQPTADLRAFAFTVSYALLFLFVYGAVNLFAAVLRKAGSGTEQMD
jgi:uncharacterized membrane protein